MLAGSPHGPSAWGLGSEPQDPHPHGGCLQPVEKSKATACGSLPPPCPKGLGSPQVLLAAAPQLGCAPEDTVGWLSTHCVDTAPTSKELCEQGTVNPFVRVQQATYSLCKVAFLAWFTFFFSSPTAVSSVSSRTVHLAQDWFVQLPLEANRVFKSLFSCNTKAPSKPRAE